MPRYSGAVDFNRGRETALPLGRPVLHSLGLTVGLMTDNLAEITEGLTPKEMVVARPARDITAGMRVETNEME